jgi:hypothetical protein
MSKNMNSKSANFTIYLIIILILCGSIFAIYFQSSIKNKDKYNINEFGIKELDENYLNGNNIIKQDDPAQDIILDQPNYKIENSTQFNFKRLFDSLKKINRETKKLHDSTNYNFYTQSTTEDKLRMNLSIISKYVILLINNDGYYDFNVTNFGDVEIWIDKKGNEEIKYELFLWDKKNYFQLKLKVHILKFIEEQEIKPYGIRDKHYIFNYYNIGFPHLDQLIPLPEEISVSGRFDLGTTTIRPNNPSKIKLLYINSIQVQNSTLIVDYEKDKYPFNKLEVGDKGFSGVNDSTLEYTGLNKNATRNDPYVEFGREYNKWPTLYEEPDYIAQFPAKNPPKHWDDSGIYYYGDDDTPALDKSKCLNTETGVAWSAEKLPLQPQFWPTLATLPRNCGTYNDLFDISKGPVGNNTFIGGGKR